MGSRKERLELRKENGVAVISLGHVEIWDGADLALLRETLTRLIQRERNRSVAVDMTTVKYIPSGFFGLLFDWHERGVAIRLFAPQDRVANMLWFRQFFHAEMGNWFLLHSEPKECLTFDDSADWNDEQELVTGPQPSPAVLSHK